MKLKEISTPRRGKASKIDVFIRRKNQYSSNPIGLKLLGKISKGPKFLKKSIVQTTGYKS